MEEQLDTSAAESEDEQSIIPDGWTTPPTVMKLKEDLLAAQPSHDTQEGKIDVWLDNLYVRGTALIKVPEGSSQVQPKLIRKQAEWRYASLSEPFLNTDDLFSATPVTWEDEKSATQNALVLNSQVNSKIDKVAFIDQYIRAAVDQGTAIVRVGWVFEEEEVLERQPIVEFYPNPQLAPLHQELHKLKQSNPTGYRFEVPVELQQAHDITMNSGTPMEPRVTGMKEVKVMKTIRNHPSVEVCDYRNVIVDPTCQGDAEKASFLIFSFETSKSQLERDSKYSNLDKINLDTNSVLAQPDHASEDNSANFNFKDDARKKIVAYEYWGFWDVDGSGVTTPIVATWVGDTMIRLEENPYPDKALPFVIVPFLPVRNSVYGEPDGELLIDNQKIAGAVTRGMIDIMGKSANGQTGYRKDALDATNRRKFLKGHDYEYNGQVDPSMAFHMHTFPEIPQSAQFMLQLQNMDAESMTGVRAFANTGVNGSGLGDVATAVRGAMDAASKRETGILRRLASGMVKIGRKIIAMNQEFMEEEEVIRITNGEFVPVRRDDLAGKIDLKLDISTIEEDNVKAQELAFMLQTMGNNMDPGMTKLILRDIARLRKMPELAHQIEVYEPQPDPMEQQIKQLTIQKLQAEVAEINARAMSLQSEAQLDQAKVGETQAKTRLMGSQADITDLDFMEQESGVKQERDKELQGEQARSNMQRDVMQHGFKVQQDANKELMKYKLQKKSAKKK